MITWSGPSGSAASGNDAGQASIEPHARRGPLWGNESGDLVAGGKQPDQVAVGGSVGPPGRQMVTPSGRNVSPGSSGRIERYHSLASGAWSRMLVMPPLGTGVTLATWSGVISA